jgi:hypothetical protein
MTDSVCSSFILFCTNPDKFFANHFTGMTPAIAHFLMEHVFCILDDAMDSKGKHATACELGRWVWNLPNLLGQDTPVLLVPMALVRSQVQAESEPDSKPGPLACAELKSVEGAESVSACTGTSGDDSVGIVTGAVGGAIVRDGCAVDNYHAVAAFGFAAVAAIACVVAQAWSLECEY